LHLRQAKGGYIPRLESPSITEEVKSIFLFERYNSEKNDCLLKEKNDCLLKREGMTFIGDEGWLNL
jgi:hypothetical protein